MFNITTTGRWRDGQVLASWGTSSFAINLRIQQRIDREWEKASARLGDKLFDGPMCRLEDWPADDSALRLTLSRTSYRIFLGTNLSRQPLAADSMANPVGVSAV